MRLNLYSHLIRSFALPWVSVLTHSNFWSLYKQFQKNARHMVYAPSPDEVLDQLRALVSHTYHNVPFYREHMDTCGLTPDFASFDDFQKLPPTTKADITANFPDRFTASHQEFKPWRYTSTSGTIERLTVIQDFRKRDVGRAAQLHALNSATGYQPGMKYIEIPPDICRNVCGASDTVEPDIFGYFLKNLKERKVFEAEIISDLRGLIERQIVYRRLELSSFGSEGLMQKPEVLDECIKRIDDYQPYVLKALPIYLYLLALHILEKKLRPPRIAGGLMPMGSSVTPYMKQVIESAFDCLVHEDYGCAELGGIAAECGRQRGLHPFRGLFYIEVVRHGQPVNDGEFGKVLITDFSNYAMPLIRYDIGDVAILRRGPCECGLPGDRIEIQGRVQDCLVGADGTVLTPDKVVDSVLERPDVLGFQLELREENEAYLQIVPKGSDVPNLKEISQNLSKHLKGQPRISARTVPTIRPEPGGKYRFIKNDSKAATEAF